MHLEAACSKELFTARKLVCCGVIVETDINILVKQQTPNELSKLSATDHMYVISCTLPHIKT